MVTWEKYRMNNFSRLPYFIFFQYVGGIYKIEAKVILIAYMIFGLYAIVTYSCLERTHTFNTKTWHSLIFIYESAIVGHE